MKGNDLSNIIVPRDVLVFEGLLGQITSPKTRAVEKKMRDKGKWKQAVALYEINEILARKLWDLSWRFSVEINMVTYLGHEFAEALEERVEREQLPIRRVWSETPEIFARSLVYQPDIRHVYDPDPSHQFLYGAKGRTLLPEQANLFGAM